MVGQLLETNKPQTAKTLTEIQTRRIAPVSKQGLNNPISVIIVAKNNENDKSTLKLKDEQVKRGTP